MVLEKFSFKISKFVSVNQLFQLLKLVCIYMYGHSFFELSCMLMRKNVNNDIGKDLPI